MPAAATAIEAAEALRTLPDLLHPPNGTRLDLVFVGINPGEASARAGHYYAHPGNRFWPSLAASGLVRLDAFNAPLGPDDDARLAAHGIGFTDVVKRVVTDSTQVSRAEFAAAIPAFRARIASARPRVVCFTAARAFDEVFPGVRGANAWGPQPVTLEGAEVWVTPSTSGLASKWRGEVTRVLAELATHLGRQAGRIEAAS